MTARRRLSVVREPDTPPVTDYRQPCTCGHTALRHGDTQRWKLAGTCLIPDCDCAGFAHATPQPIGA